MGSDRQTSFFLTDIPAWVWFPLVLMLLGSSAAFGSWWYLTGSVTNVEVPELEGRELDDVRTILQEKGLQARVVLEPSMETPEGRVIRQAPSAGSVIRDNRVLELRVSDGPAYVTVPDLRGEDLVTARNTLVHQTQGETQFPGTQLNLGNISRTYSESVPEGQVISQNPSPNREVVRGSQVDVLLSRGPWPRTVFVPEVLDRPFEEAVRELEQAGLDVAEPRYNLDPDAPASVVLSQSPRPGQLVQHGEQVTLTVNLEDPELREPQHRHTMLRVSPPGYLQSGELRVVLRDIDGESVLFEDHADAGRLLEFPVRFRGSAEVYLYWNDDLYSIRSLEEHRF